MNRIQESSELAKVTGGSISKQMAPLSVGQLEHALLERYPRSDAEPWDRMGLLVGDPRELVSGVFVTLDPTPAAIRTAAASGANVLLTHHPVFIEPPQAFSPVAGVASGPGVAVWQAIAQGVSLINIHTALDVSPEALKLLPSLLSLDYQGVLLPLEGNAQKGYGQICKVRAQDAPLRLEQLAARCVSVFGCTPRVWGVPSLSVADVVIANGSAGNMVEPCRRKAPDCLICGEVHYHDAQDLAQAGVAIIELGHDVSEFPLTALLAQAALACGVDKADVTIFDQLPNWTAPDSTRM